MSKVYNQLKKKFFRKKVLIVGLGLQGGGVGLAKFFAELGSKVIVTDKKNYQQLSQSIYQLKDYPIKFHLGSHDIKDFLNANYIFKGPSVPWLSFEIVEAQKRGIVVDMEMAFVMEYYPGKMIGITGTRGKSTTTHLIYNLLNQSGFKVSLGGGLPGISTINYLKNADKNNWLVTELSSWALSCFHRKKISPHIAVFTNLYPDHLNYYKNINEYLYDKKAIFMYQKKQDYLIVNQNLKPLVFDSVKSNVIFFSKKNFPYQLKYLRGDHNLENAAASLEVAKILKISQDQAVKIISNFKGISYRQQIIREKNGVIFVNDTTSTTPIATIKAIDSFKDKKIVLILGGNSKNLPFDELINKLGNVEKIILLAGSFTEEIIDQLKKRFPDKITKDIYDNLEKAVIKAYQIALKINPSIVLFSPGATSFAMFNNEFHRGDEFNKIVASL